jgi:hypothetical protein
MLRLFGGRDIVFGELTWFVRPRSGIAMTVEERRETRRLMWANVATDAMDIAVLAFCVSKGAIGKTGAALVGGGAVAFLGMGLMVARELQE